MRGKKENEKKNRSVFPLQVDPGYIFMFHLIHPGCRCIDVPPAVCIQLCKWAASADEKRSLSGEPWHMAEEWNSSGGVKAEFISVIAAHSRFFCVRFSPFLLCRFALLCYWVSISSAWCSTYSGKPNKNGKKGTQSVELFGDIVVAHSNI